MSGLRNIRLLLTDVDGTLVTNDKMLTAATKAVARELHHAGIALAITSSRPPRGLRMLVEPLALRIAIAGLNGGVYVNPDLSLILSHTLDPATARQAVNLILDRGLDVWVYTADEWLIRDQSAPHVAREAWISKFNAKVVTSFTHTQIGARGEDRRHLISRWSLPARRRPRRPSAKRRALRARSLFLDVTDSQAMRFQLGRWVAL